LESRLFAALGAVPVGCSTPEAKQRFVSREVDAVSISDSAAHTVGLWREAKYRTDANLVRVNLEYGLSPSFHEQLAPRLRPVLNSWMRGLAQAGAQLFYGLAGARARVAFREGGMQFISLGAQEQARWRERLAPVGQQLAKELTQLGYPARQMIADLHDAAATYAGWSADRLMTEALERPLHDLLPGGTA
jgi:TRAP-type C4-dicarboxylate transport system substrate-binding protein